MPLGETQHRRWVIKMLDDFTTDHSVECSQVIRIVINTEIVKCCLGMALCRDLEAFQIRLDRRHLITGRLQTARHRAVTTTNVEYPLAAKPAQVLLDRSIAVIDRVGRGGGLPAVGRGGSFQVASCLFSCFGRNQRGQVSLIWLSVVFNHRGTEGHGDVNTEWEQQMGQVSFAQASC